MPLGCFLGGGGGGGNRWNLVVLFLFYSNVVLGVGLRAACMQGMDSTS